MLIYVAKADESSDLTVTYLQNNSKNQMRINLMRSLEKKLQWKKNYSHKCNFWLKWKKTMVKWIKNYKRYARVNLIHG